MDTARMVMGLLPNNRTFPFPVLPCFQVSNYIVAHTLAVIPITTATQTQMVTQMAIRTVIPAAVDTTATEQVAAIKWPTSVQV